MWSVPPHVVPSTSLYHPEVGTHENKTVGHGVTVVSVLVVVTVGLGVVAVFVFVMAAVVVAVVTVPRK